MSVVVLTLVGAVAPAADAASCPAGSNPIACENLQPGADPSLWEIIGAGDGSIQGFSTDISVNVGQRIDFKIDTDADAYTIGIFRTGWYGGLGARRIATVQPSASLPQRQPECLSDVTTELYDCGTWAVSASWNVPANAVSGVYLAVLTRGDTGGRSQITFVVRNTASTSAVLFQTSDPTWQAYNTYGGSDFYQGAANGRAYKLSYNRPVTTRGDNDGRDFYFANEYPMVRFLERNGYDVSYFSGIDTDRFGSTLRQHKVFLSVGHDEYWSGAQRSAVEAGRDAGVNLQFLSGNEVYWRTRYEASPVTGTAYRTLVTYKETWENEKIDPAVESTATWRDPRLSAVANGGGRPENRLTGTMYMSNFSDLPVTVSAAEGKLRLWRNTPLASLPAGSSAALAPHTIGYESNEDVDNGSRPPGLIRLSTTTGAVPQYLQDFGNVVAPGTTTHHLTLYKASNGALVFSAGSVQWTWGLDATHDGDGAPADVRMQQAQLNLLADMNAQPTTRMPGLVAASRSTDTAGPTVTVTAPAATSSAANGSIVQVTGTAADASGRVAGVEVSTDAGATWHPADGTTSWRYSFVLHGSDTGTVRVRAVDDSANIGATVTRSITITGSASVFGQELPVRVDSGDPSSVTLGLRFTPTTDGFISGVRFYKSSANTGSHTGTLWSAQQQQLATVTFSAETASGWQTASFATPVPVTAGTSYVVSYTTATGRYSAADWFWASAGRTAAPLTVAGGFGATPAGVYSTNGGFPSDSYRGGNYYVDAVFSTVDATPLTASAQAPLPDSSSVSPSTSVSAVFSKPVIASTVAITLKNAAGAVVAGSTGYVTATRTATFSPTAPLAADTVYTATLTATATGGSPVSSGGTWSFRTQRQNAVVGACPCSLYDDSTVPGVAEVAETTPVTLGVRFSPTVDGTVSAIRFYKSAGNTGSHSGILWDAAGQEIARGTFAGESSRGWQTLTFASPIAVTAGADYTAGYTSPTGRYSVTVNGFGGGGTRGPLITAADSGAYSYSGGFAGSRSSASYLVDVVFTPR